MIPTAPKPPGLRARRPGDLLTEPTGGYRRAERDLSLLKWGPAVGGRGTGQAPLAPSYSPSKADLPGRTGTRLGLGQLLHHPLSDSADELDSVGQA